MTSSSVGSSSVSVISTHTLTWSVTEFFDNEMYIPKISTHTLTWSVTIGGVCRTLPIGISTHTLTWSVTRSHNIEQITKMNFNSHAHVERDIGGGM